MLQNSAYPSLSAEQVQALLSLGYTASTVTSVSAAGSDHVWDVSLADTDDLIVPHSIITNGIITHNSFDSQYFLSIARHVGVIKDDEPDDTAMHKIFGLKDDKNNWLIPPRIRYYPMSIGEKFFDLVAKLERSLPDKLFKSGRWWLVYDDTKENKKYKSQADEALLKKTGKYWVETDNGYPQAIIAVDSYPAMMPEKQDVDDPGQGLGAQARMFADNIKRVKGKMNSKRITVMGVNQLRLRPMVQFGCFTYNSKVSLADGTTLEIGKIVNNKMDVMVMSYDPISKKFEPKKVIGWFNNGNAARGELIKLSVNNGSKAQMDLNCTRGHKIYDPITCSFKPAESFQVGDKLLASTTIHKFNDDQMQLIYGSVLGDGSLRRMGSGKVKLRFAQGPDQADYLNWKFSMLRDISTSVPVQHKTNYSWGFDSIPMGGKLLSSLAKTVNVRTGKKKKFSGIPKKLLKKIDLRGLAVWYMDDGTFYQSKYSKQHGQYWHVGIACARLSKEQRVALAEVIYDLTGVMFKIKPRGLYLFDKEKIRVFHAALAPYALESMRYKFVPDTQDFSSYTWDTEIKGVKKGEFLATVVSIDHDYHPKPGSSSAKYDLQIEDNHTYMVGGVVVHNSPEYEPCMVGSTPVLLANGGTETIEKIVSNKLELEVLSFDPYTSEISAKPILDWKDNGVSPASELLTLVYQLDDGQVNRITCTKNHKIWTSQGWVAAEDLVEESTVYLNGPNNRLTESTIVQILYDQVQDQKVYDLTVADNHTYFVGGPTEDEEKTENFALAVSNCGESLKFFCMADDTTITIRDMGGELKVLTIKDLIRQYQYEIKYQVLTAEGWETPKLFAWLGKKKCISMDIREEYEQEVSRTFTGSEEHRVMARCADESKQDWHSLKEMRDSGATWYVRCVSELNGNYFLARVSPSDFKDAGLLDVYDFNFESGTVITSGIVSHNSDTRIKMTSRSVQGGSGQIEEEEGINGGIDQYRYIHMRAAKNKLSIPNLEGWARIWVKDAQGQAHGYDPVYDAHYFMKEIGILSGTKNRIKIDLPKMAGHKPLSWMNFKRLILGDKAMVKKVMNAHGIEKPFNLRKELFKLFESGKAMEMYFAKKKADADGKSSDDSDDASSDD